MRNLSHVSLPRIVQLGQRMPSYLISTIFSSFFVYKNATLKLNVFLMSRTSIQNTISTAVLNKIPSQITFDAWEAFGVLSTIHPFNKEYLFISRLYFLYESYYSLYVVLWHLPCAPILYLSHYPLSYIQR